MAAMMTAKRLSQQLAELPVGTQVFLLGGDRMFFGPHTARIAGYIDFHTENAIHSEGGLLPDAQGQLTAIEHLDIPPEPEAGE